MQTQTSVQQVSASAGQRSPTGPASTPTKTLSNSNSSNSDASFDAWLNIQNGNIVPKSQQNHIVGPKRQSLFEGSDSDLSDDEELVEIMPCGTKKFHPQMEEAVTSFIEKQKAKGQGEEMLKEGRGRSSRRKKDRREGSGRSGSAY